MVPNLGPLGWDHEAQHWAVATNRQGNGGFHSTLSRGVTRPSEYLRKNTFRGIAPSGLAGSSLEGLELRRRGSSSPSET